MKNYILIGSLVLLVVLGFSYFTSEASVADDGVYNYYQITSTNASTSPQLVKQGQGVFGSIVIASSTSGTLEIYDGTTMTLKSLGTGTTLTAATTSATTTISKFAASSANGTYTYDVAFTNGLSIMPSTDFNGSYTITWR